MSVQDLYPAGSFDDPRDPVSGSNDPNNSREDHAFSGPGDIDRSRGDSTNARSRMWNAAATDTETDVPEYGRAFAQPGSGGTVGDDDMINHVFGES